MKTVVVFEFDKIILCHPARSPKNICQASYGTLPQAEFNTRALKSILLYRRLAYLVALAATGDERLVKESLWRLHACQLFDRFLIREEGAGRGGGLWREMLKAAGLEGWKTVKRKELPYGYLLLPEKELGG